MEDDVGDLLQILSRRDVAAILGISLVTLWRMVDRGCVSPALPHFPGARWVVREHGEGVDSPKGRGVSGRGGNEGGDAAAQHPRAEGRRPRPEDSSQGTGGIVNG